MVNNINFTGKTDFYISPTAYQKVERITQQAYRNLNKNSNSRIYNNRICSINTDPNYLTVIMKNEHTGFLKYIPLRKECGELIDEISSNLEMLRKSKGKENITAWILGGTRSNSRNGENVTKKLDEIANIICDRKDIDTSILVGSNTGEEIFILHAGINKIDLFFDKIVNPKRNLNAELEKMFDYVELNNTNLSYMA